ncbi:MAG: HNH endonuclease [candidate division Zixibacteria bacterium]|nr:HNH endonuclease [candidate division Zixibacteria bacterium]
MDKIIRRPWRRDELLIAFRLYCQIPFGRINKDNSMIKRVAKILGRTPSSLAMKLANFASLDPIQRKRGIKGLSNVSMADRRIWKEFNQDWEGRVLESAEHIRTLSLSNVIEGAPKDIGHTETERMGTTKVRLVQQFFRNAVLSAYRNVCAICSLELPQLLIASHIIPWSMNVTLRADPRNGISLCALHDRAFDRGLITIDENLKVCVSSTVPEKTKSKLQDMALLKVVGFKIISPDRFAPSEEALAYHRDSIFVK